MKKTLFIIISLFILNTALSQEIYKTYIYKIEKTKSRLGSGIKWNYIDMDSLVLYKNQTFHWTKKYMYHQIDFTELKGEWKIEDDVLQIYIKSETDTGINNKWYEIDKYCSFEIRRRKIKPIDGIEFAARKLKLLKD